MRLTGSDRFCFKVNMQYVLILIPEILASVFRPSV